MFELSTEWWQILIRVSSVYVFLLILVRMTGKRHLGQLAPMDLLTVLLVSETVSPALTGDDTSLTAGWIAATTLFALSLGIAIITFRYHRIERVIEGAPAILVQDGRLDMGVMTAERITAQDLEVALRRNNVSQLAEIVLGVVEPNGEITLIKRDAT